VIAFGVVVTLPPTTGLFDAWSQWHSKSREMLLSGLTCPPPSRPVKVPLYPKFLILIIIVALTRIPARAQAADLVLTPPAEAQLDSLASHMIEKIKKANRDETPTKILVFDFTWETPESSSLFGTLLADRFSDMLKSNNGVEIIDRQKLKDYLKENYANIEHLKSNLLCLEFAKDIGATTIIRAQLMEDRDRQLKIVLQAVGDALSLFDNAEFAITKDAEDMLFQPVPSYSGGPDSIPAEPGVLVMGSQGIIGVSSPLCITCPNPSYSTTARAKKLQGTVVLAAVVTTTGQVTSIYIVKPLPGGLTQQAVKTVKNWKLKPAMKDGQPIAVRVDIEMTFRLT
jgi:TonB family protein